MPAAAVIPAPIAYIKVVAVKKLVVGFLVGVLRSRASGELLMLTFLLMSALFLIGWRRSWDLYFEKIRVFKAGLCLNTLAWNNGIGLVFYFVGF